METEPLSRESVSILSRWELVSIYINGGYGEDARMREELERQFVARGLPIPRPYERGQAKPAAVPPMSRETFLSYLLLIYTVTGLFYAWLYLPLRLIRGDFQKDRKNHLIQTGICVVYQAAEVATAYLLTEMP